MMIKKKKPAAELWLDGSARPLPVSSVIVYMNTRDTWTGPADQRVGTTSC